MSDSVAFLRVTSRRVDRCEVGKSHFSYKALTPLPSLSLSLSSYLYSKPKVSFQEGQSPPNPRLLPTLVHGFPRLRHNSCAP